MIFRRVASAVLALLINVPVTVAQDIVLPQRQSPNPQTTNGVPHVQLGIEPDPVLSELLLESVAMFPGVTLGPTRVSLPGAVGFQIDQDVTLAHPEVVVGGREFAHLHPDGSLHASLNPDLAEAAVQAGWAVPHPWANQREGWEGFVMIFTPTSEGELDVVTMLVEQSYSFVTGRELQKE